MPKKAEKTLYSSGNKGIKSLIFDLGNVLFRLDRDRFLKNISCCSRFSKKEIEEKLRGLTLFKLYESGFISSQAFFHTFSGLLRLKISYSEFSAAFDSYLVPIPENLCLVDDLRAQYKLAVISNTNELHFQYLAEKYSIDKKFRYLSLSYRVGFMKPSREIFEDCIRHLRIQPENCLYIDDIPAYVNAAKSLGFQAVSYVSHKKLLGDLKDYSVI
jgi:glucose-1-phosphatase